MKIRFNVLISAILLLVVIATMLVACTTPESITSTTSITTSAKTTSDVNPSTTGETTNMSTITTETTSSDVAFPEVPRMTCQDLKALLDNKDPNLIVIDARDPGSYQSGHIPGAVNMYVSLTMNPIDRDMMFGAIPPGRTVVAYCDCPGEETSGQTVLYIWGIRYDKDKVFALKGGISEWRTLGYPIEKSNT